MCSGYLADGIAIAIDGDGIRPIGVALVAGPFAAGHIRSLLVHNDFCAFFIDDDGGLHIYCRA